MASRLNLDFFADTDCQDIPNLPGIYAFYLRAVSPGAVGLLELKPSSEAHAKRIRKRMAALVGKFLALSRTSHARGFVREIGRARHLTTSFEVSLQEQTTTDPITKLSMAIPEADLRAVLTLCGRISLFAQPIYVGITLDQTLNERYQQHRRDHSTEPAEMKTFGGRLQSQGFSWSDIVFGCMPTESRSLERNSMRFLEKYFQALTRPIFSKR